MSGFKGHTMFSFLFQHISHCSRKHDLSQGCSFARFCSVIFIPFLCGCRRRVVVSSVGHSACLQSRAACAFVWQLMRAPQDVSSVTWFLRMFSEAMRASIGNWVKLLQCLDRERDKRASFSLALLPLLKVKWQINDRTGCSILPRHLKNSHNAKQIHSGPISGFDQKVLTFLNIHKLLLFSAAVKGLRTDLQICSLWRCNPEF